MSSLKVSSPLVSVGWLERHLDHPDLVILDGSWHMPNVKRDGKLEWLKQRIPKARFFDFDREVCDRKSTLPHMLPVNLTFKNRYRISVSIIIVRLWFTILWGCSRVLVYGGCLKRWDLKTLRY